MKVFNTLILVAFSVLLSQPFTTVASRSPILPIFAGPTAYGPTTLIRTPSLDSAVFQSDRIGGNFAYSTIEGHAYAAITPFVKQKYVPTIRQEANPIQYQSSYYTPSELPDYDGRNNDPAQEYDQQFQQQHYQPFDFYDSNIVRSILYG